MSVTPGSPQLDPICILVIARLDPPWPPNSTVERDAPRAARPQLWTLGVSMYAPRYRYGRNSKDTCGALDHEDRKPAP